MVGFSLGGMIARRFALDHPDRLSALAILHSAHDRTPAERESVRERVRHTQREHGPCGERGLRPGTLVHAGVPRRERRNLIALIRGWITSNDPAVFARIYGVLAEGDAEIARGLERIACPTLVMTGADDPGNTPAMSKAMAERIPGARLTIPAGPQAHGARRIAGCGQRADVRVSAQRTRGRLTGQGHSSTFGG